jgi:hypothetical protein
MHGVDPQIARSPLGVRFTALADGDCGGTRFLEVSEPLTIAYRATQVLQVAVGNPGQPFKLGFAIFVELAL